MFQKYLNICFHFDFISYLCRTRCFEKQVYCILEVNINTCHPYFVNKGSGPFQKHIGRFLRYLRIRLVQYQLVQLGQVDTSCLLQSMSHGLADYCHRDILTERLGSPRMACHIGSQLHRQMQAGADNHEQAVVFTERGFIGFVPVLAPLKGWEKGKGNLSARTFSRVTAWQA